MKPSLLLCWIFFCTSPFFAHGQSDYYWSDGEKIFLTTDASTMSVFFSEPQLLHGESNKEMPPIIAERKNAHSPARWAVLNTSGLESGELVSDTESIIRTLGYNPDNIRSAAYGRITDQQDLVWLTHNVTFRENEAFSAAAFMELLSAFPAASLKYTGGGLPYIESEDIATVLPIANRMYESGMFHYAQPSFRHIGRSNTTHAEQMIEGCNPSDPKFSDQMVLDNDGPNTSISTYNYPFWAPNKNGTDINVTDAWCITEGNASTVIAVFDEGVEAHKDLETAAGVSRVLNGYNTDPVYATNGGPVGDDEVHGMGISGIIAASHDGVGIAGIAPEVQILPVHAFQDSYDDLHRADGIMWAYKNGADIIVNAWTYQSCTYYASVVEEAIDSALTYGRGGLGTFVIFSAGYVDPGEASCVKFPANLSQVYTMGAMGTDRNSPDYAPTGPELDAVGISSVDSSHAFVATLDRMVLGNNCYTTPAAYLEYSDTAYTKYFGGTSTTAAEAAGIAALVLDIDSSLTATQIANILSSSTRDFGMSLDSLIFGAGVLDAHAAVLAAQSPVFPVAWSYLEGEALGDRIKLSWGTLSEIHADRFEVQRLGAEEEFVKLGEVSAAGTSQFPNDYQFFDLTPSIGENIYRLKQLDVDGAFTYSDHVEVEFSSTSIVSRPYPNPSNGSPIAVDMMSPSSQTISYKLTDLTGRMVADGQVEVLADSEKTLVLSAEDLAAGIYILRITDESGSALSTSELVVK